MVADCEVTLRESRWREQGVKQWAEWKTSAPEKLVNNGFSFRVHFLHHPFCRVSQNITTEFIWLRLIDLLWLLSGDMNLSIVVLVDFFWFQANRNTFSLLFVSRQQDQWIKVVSNKFRMSSSSFSMILISKNETWVTSGRSQRPEWARRKAAILLWGRGWWLWSGGCSYCGCDFMRMIFLGFIRWHYQARLSAR